jgi:hypothetical protein
MCCYVLSFRNRDRPRHSFKCPFLCHLIFLTPENLSSVLPLFSTMLDSFVSVVQRNWPATLLIIVTLFLASNYFTHGLNRYPGPLLATLTDWWRFFDVYGRRPEITHIKLHRQHGDVVRLGPNVLSFSDPAAIKQIYGLNRGFVKVG